MQRWKPRSKALSKADGSIVVTGWCHYHAPLTKVKFLTTRRNMCRTRATTRGTQGIPLRLSACHLLPAINLFEEQISKMLVWSETEKITPEQQLNASSTTTRSMSGI